MADAVIGDKIVFRCSGDDLGDDLVKGFPGLEGQENGARVGAHHVDVPGPVHFLVRPGQFMFFNQALFVFLDAVTGDDAVLFTAAHGLTVDVVTGLVVPDENLLVDHLLHIGLRQFVHVITF